MHWWFWLLLLATQCSGQTEKIEEMDSYAFAKQLSQEAASVAASKEQKCWRHLCNQELYWPGCNCDLTCYQTRTCCLDAFTFREETLLMGIDIYACLGNTNFSKVDMMAVIGWCPNLWSVEEVKRQCEAPGEFDPDPLLNMPIASATTGQVYKNLACARCNEGENAVFELQFNCKEKIKEGQLALKQFLETGSCHPSFPPKVDFKLCPKMNSTIISCPPEWTHPDEDVERRIRWRCETYLSPITLEGLRYKNIFCASCNGISSVKGKAVCRRYLFPVVDQFNVKMDGNFERGGEIPNSDFKRCDPGNIYDPFLKKCRQIVESLRSMYSFSRKRMGVTDTQNSRLPRNRRKLLCDLVKYGSSSYEDIQGNEKKEEYILIKPTLKTYFEGEYRMDYATDEVEVCKKHPKSPAMCIDNYCSNSDSVSPSPCSCDPKCYETSDCCLDALSDNEVQLAMENDIMDCVDNQFKQFLFVVVKCPGDYEGPASIRESCEYPSPYDFFLHIPVYSGNLTYRNIYCAVCHGVRKPKYLNVRVECQDVYNVANESQALKMATVNADICRITLYTPPELPNFPSCGVEDVDTCPEEWTSSSDPYKLEVSWKCLRYFAHVYFQDILYRNIYCAECHGVDINQELRCHPHNKESSTNAKKSFVNSVIFTIGNAKEQE